MSGTRSDAAKKMLEDFKPDEVDLEPLDVKDMDQKMQAEGEANVDAASEVNFMVNGAKKAVKK